MKNPNSDPNPWTKPETRTAAPKNEPYSISAKAPRTSPSVALPGFLLILQQLVQP